MKDLNKAIQGKKIVIGSKSVMRELKNGNLVKIYISKHCSSEVKEDFEKYGKMSDVKIVDTGETSSDLGILCKKQYNIQAIGLKK